MLRISWSFKKKLNVQNYCFSFYKYWQFWNLNKKSVLLLTKTKINCVQISLFDELSNCILKQNNKLLFFFFLYNRMHLIRISRVLVHSFQSIFSENIYEGGWAGSNNNDSLLTPSSRISALYYLIAGSLNLIVPKTLIGPSLWLDLY